MAASRATMNFLYRMRTGVCPEVGGWRHRVTDPCPACKAPLGRGQPGVPAVEHFFSCPALAGVRTSVAGSAAAIDPIALWTDPETAIKLALATRADRRAPAPAAQAAPAACAAPPHPVA
jgi:hypothetical protein